MKLFVGGLIGLILSVSVGAEPLLEGQVRPVVWAASGWVCRCGCLIWSICVGSVGTTTDETGYFALSLQAFSTDKGHGSAD